MEGRREWDEEKDGSWQAEDPGCISCLISPCNQHGARCFLIISPPLPLTLRTCEMEITLSSLCSAWEGQAIWGPLHNACSDNSNDPFAHLLLGRHCCKCYTRYQYPHLLDEKIEAHNVKFSSPFPLDRMENLNLFLCFVVIPLTHKWTVTIIL